MKDLIICLLTTYIVNGFEFWIKKPAGFPVYLFIAITTIYYFTMLFVKDRRNK